MATSKQTAANRRNAKRSTGPKTDGGKAVAKLNAVSHGLRSAAPVVPGERPEDWDAFRCGMVTSLSPVGLLEVELVERVALLSWRLRRVAAYEAGVTGSAAVRAVAKALGDDDRGAADDWAEALGLPRTYSLRSYALVRGDLEQNQADAAAAEARRDDFRRLADRPSDEPVAGEEALQLLAALSGYFPDGRGRTLEVTGDEFLAAVGVPEEWRDDPDAWGGWMAGAVLAGAAVIAKENGMSVSDLLAQAAVLADRDAAVERRRAEESAAKLARLEPGARAAAEAARRRALVPPADIADKVARYEAHLSKQLTQALHALERMRAARSGNPPAPPAALDVTIDGGPPALPAAG